MTLYRRVFDSVLTHVDPEVAHRAGLGAIRAARPVLGRVALRRAGADAPIHVLGLTFAHRLGLAAVFDKSAAGVDALAALGFAHVEVGSVTARPQPGNPRPRLVRLTADRAVVNRMGFNNDGAEVVARRLAERALSLDRRYPPGAPRPVVGVNIGKSRIVPEHDRAAVLADHETTTRLLAPHAHYLVVNVSSPNTPGLRDLQAVERLAPLLEHVRRTADRATAHHRVPLLVKIAPDLADDDVLAVADLALAQGLDGIVATNTTITRDGLTSPVEAVTAAGAGGLSGPPLADRSLKVLRLLRERCGPAVALVGVGGVTTEDDVVRRIAAGADLVQAYTAFVYHGPAWPRRAAAAGVGVAVGGRP